VRCFLCSGRPHLAAWMLSAIVLVLWSELIFGVRNETARVPQLSHDLRGSAFH
jgi:hypothetical protein